jgi:HlyD family secretion protein
MKRTWTLLAIAFLYLCGCGRTSANYTEGKLFVSGRIDGDTVDISSKRPGQISEIKVREGDSVQAGQILAVISSAQDEARYDAQKARVLSDKHRMDQLRRQLGTYKERIRQAQIYQAQAESNAPAHVKQAEANLATSKAELVRSEAELQQSKIDAERYPPLAQMGAVAKQVAEQYKTKLDVAEASVDAKRKEVAAAEASLQAAMAELYNPPIKEADRFTLEGQVEELKEQIASAQADVAADEGELRRIEADLADLKIVAPIDGTILTRSAEPGRVIASGQTILTMVDLQKLYLRGFIPEGNVGMVKVGQSAEVYLDSNPQEMIPAEVIRIDPQTMFTPENTYFQEDRVKQVMGVKLGLRGGYGFAKPGMPADGQILIGSQ